jgi:hypothetical protein
MDVTRATWASSTSCRRLELKNAPLVVAEESLHARGLRRLRG